jgi:hypothetical protein
MAASGRRRWLLATAIGSVLIAGGFVTWYVNAALQGAMKVQCLSIVQDIVTSLQMYAEDYGRFPPTGGWCDRLLPYVGGREAFRCPSPWSNRASAYALNAAVAGMPYDHEAADHMNGLILVFESDHGWNAAGGPELLPRRPRHQGGDVYGIVDGEYAPPDHLRGAAWVPRDQMTNGTAGIVWDPRAAKANDGRGKPARGG